MKGANVWSVGKVHSRFF